MAGSKDGVGGEGGRSSGGHTMNLVRADRSRGACLTPSFSIFLRPCTLAPELCHVMSCHRHLSSSPHLACHPPSPLLRTFPPPTSPYYPHHIPTHTNTRPPPPPSPCPLPQLRQPLPKDAPQGHAQATQPPPGPPPQVGAHSNVHWGTHFRFKHAGLLDSNNKKKTTLMGATGVCGHTHTHIHAHVHVCV